MEGRRIKLEEVHMNTLTINSVSSRLTAADRLDHALARLGVRRNHHRVTPGLYAVGRPDAAAPVLVTANYSLSFDALRSSLSGIDAFILVLDTQGVNVWCAAGKGTFGTDEIVRRIEAVDLARAVTHRRLIVPQLGGAGVAAHEVKLRTGFTVEYGPVDTSDLPEYLRTRKADAGMRRVKFGIKARAVLAVIEA
ncbi:MAG: carbon monoxide dehydrogenase, partial [Spirochaetales bacterium]